MLLWLLLYRTDAQNLWQVLATYADEPTLLADGPARLAGRTSGQAAAASIQAAYAITSQVSFAAIPLV